MVANALVFGAAESPEWYEPLERTVLEALKGTGDGPAAGKSLVGICEVGVCESFAAPMGTGLLKSLKYRVYAFVIWTVELQLLPNHSLHLPQLW